MIKMTLRFIAGWLIAGLMASVSAASSSSSERTVFYRDATYEQNLRWQASEDRTITPARVIRWLRGSRGAAVFASVTPAEFQPIVNVQDSHVRIVATIAYKF